MRSLRSFLFIAMVAILLQTPIMSYLRPLNKQLINSRGNLARFRCLTAADAQTNAQTSNSDRTKNNKKNLVFLGTPLVALRSLEILHKASKSEDSSFDIVGVVSQPPTPQGKRHKLTKNPVHEYAESNNLPIYAPETAKDENFLTSLEALGIDVCITAAYGNYLPKRFLAIPKYGTINIHPSLLPKYRGAAPVQRCLEQGDQETGVSVLYTVTKMDAGPIIKQIRLPLKGDEKATPLLEHLFIEGTNHLLDVLPKVFSSEITMTKNVTVQDDSQATHAPKIESNQSLIYFDQIASKIIHNRCRGFDGWPGIYTYWKSYDAKKNESIIRMKIITTCIIDDANYPRKSTSPDDIYSLDHAKYHLNSKEFVLILTCADGSRLGILELQPENKKVMKARDFVNGYKGNLTVKWMPTDELNSYLNANNLQTVQ